MELADRLAAFAKGDAQPLIDWFNGGADGQIDWCSPGDFDDCVSIASDKGLDSPEGFCNERHQDACGGAPGSEDTAARGGAMGAEAKVRSRSEILADWHAVISGPGLGIDDPEVGLAAALASYEHRTAEVRAWTGAQAYWELISQDERDKAAKSGAAMPDGSYPILSCEGDNSVDSAIGAVGRGGADHDAIRKHIMKRADSLGCTGKIPDNWNADGSLKDAEAAAAAAGASFVPGAPGHTEPAPAVPPSPDGDAKPPAEGEEKPEGDEGNADAAITAKIDSAATAVAEAVKAQQADPDAAKDPKDAKVLAGLEQAQKILAGVIEDQKADAAETAAKPPAPPEEKPPAEAKPTPPPPPAEKPAMTAAGQPGGPQGVAGDADDSPPGPGDIDNSVKCENPECEHLASSHGDTADGKNTGACAMVGCSCPGMVYSGQSANTGEGKAAPPEEEEKPAPPAQAAAGGHSALAAAVEANKVAAFAPPSPAPEAPQAPAVEGAPAPELPPLDPMPTAAVGPAFTCPVMWLEGTPTGDGRQVGAEALTWRTPPLPLMGLKTSPHDPSGFSPNDPAVLIGRIEKISRDGNKGTASGHLLNTEEGMDFAQILEQMGRMGVSIDVGSAQIAVMPDPSAPPGTDVFDVPLIEELTKGEIMGATVCPFAAFAGAYIVLGEGDSVPEAELAAPPEGARFAWREMSDGTCEPCEGNTSLVAAGAPSQGGGPVAPPKAWFADPGFGKTNREDPRLAETIDSKTGKPSGRFACPITVTEDGRVFGHIAQWGVCHQSPKFLNNGQCVMAPRSLTGYALFHNGTVRTAEGELLAVGKLTADAGHAPERGITAAQALAHYDNSALTAALVRAGEDEHGIWVAGSIHPSASPEQVVTLRANPPSGDWRPYGAGNELRAVLAVNTPGFPQVWASYQDGRITSLVAAGVPMFSLPAEEKPPPTLEERMAMMEHTITPLLPFASRKLQEEMAALRG